MDIDGLHGTTKKIDLVASKILWTLKDCKIYRSIFVREFYDQYVCHYSRKVQYMKYNRVANIAVVPWNLSLNWKFSDESPQLTFIVYFKYKIKHLDRRKIIWIVGVVGKKWMPTSIANGSLTSDFVDCKRARMYKQLYSDLKPYITMLAHAVSNKEIYP